jgi:HEPN domain-containing protein
MTLNEIERKAMGWLRHAAGDLASAKVLSPLGGHHADNAIFLAQQCTEKAIKAFLVLKQIEHPYTHDLERLQSLLPSKQAIQLDSSTLEKVTDSAMKSRYPFDFSGPFDTAAEFGIEVAQEVLDLVQQWFLDDNSELTL